MAISKELMKAILAMDSYNRGYGSGVDFGTGSDNIGTQIGSATIFDRNGDAEAVNASFYAIAYDLDGSGSGTDKVISFRGTDDFVIDPLTGWVVGAGFAHDEQASLAADFYDTVSGGNLFGVANPPATII